MSRALLVFSLALALVLPLDARAECRNSFVARSDGPRQIVTLLTGKLTYQEAQKLAEDIASRQAPPLEWVDDAGKLVARQFGELKVVRPMPVRCDDKPSGVVMAVTFPALQKPARTMNVKIDSKTTIAFQEQK